MSFESNDPVKEASPRGCYVVLKLILVVSFNVLFLELMPLRVENEFGPRPQNEILVHFMSDEHPTVIFILPRLSCFTSSLANWRGVCRGT